MESVGDYAILISSVMLFTTQHKRSIGKSETDNPKTTDTMIIPTTESTLRMTLMQLSETKLELTAVTEQLKEAQEEIVKLTKGWADCVLKRSKAEEQRDRLAEACKLLMAIVGEPNSSVDSCWASEDEMDAAWNMGKEALQSLNQATP